MSIIKRTNISEIKKADFSATFITLQTVVDGAPLLHNISREMEFSFQQLLQCFTLMEALCLYDKVFVIEESMLDITSKGKPESRDLIAAEFVVRSCPILAKERVIEFAYDPDNFIVDSMNRENNTRRVEKYLDLLCKAFNTNNTLFWNLDVAHVLDLPFTPSFTEAHYLLNSTEYSQSYLIGSELRKAYSKLSTTLRSEVDALLIKGRGIEIFIPPIPSILLNNASEPGDIPDLIMETRHSLERTREEFRRYETTIRDNSVSIKTSLKAVRDLRKITDELCSEYKNKGALAITEWRDIFDILSSDCDEFSEDIVKEGKLVKWLLGRPVSLILKWLKHRNVMCLFRMREKFRNIRDYESLAYRVYEKKFSTEDIIKERQKQTVIDAKIKHLLQ